MPTSLGSRVFTVPIGQDILCPGVAVNRKNRVVYSTSYATDGSYDVEIWVHNYNGTLIQRAKLGLSFRTYVVLAYLEKYNVLHVHSLGDGMIYQYEVSANGTINVASKTVVPPKIIDGRTTEVPTSNSQYGLSLGSSYTHVVLGFYDDTVLTVYLIPVNSWYSSSNPTFSKKFTFSADGGWKRRNFGLTGDEILIPDWSTGFKRYSIFDGSFLGGNTVAETTMLAGIAVSHDGDFAIISDVLYDKIFGYNITAAPSNNNPPTAPTNLSVSVAGQSVPSGTEVSLLASGSTDPDGHSISYVYEFWDGQTWIPVGTSPAGSSITHTIPPMGAVSGLKYRAKATDGLDESPYIESATFSTNGQKTTKGLETSFDTFPHEIFSTELSSNYEIQGGELIVPKTLNQIGYFQGSRSYYVSDLRTIVFEAYAKLPSTPDSYNRLGFGRYDVSTSTEYHYCLFLHKWNDTTKTYVTVGGVDYPLDALYASDYHVFRIEVTRTEARFYIDGVLKKTVSHNLTALGSPYVRAYDTQVRVSWLRLQGFFVPLENVDLPNPDNPYLKENLEYLRQKVNEFRIANGLPAYEWTDPTIIKKVTPIKAVHWNEIQQAINEVYQQMSQSYSSPDVQNTLNETILPKNRKFNVARDLKSRLDKIIRALRNE